MDNTQLALVRERLLKIAEMTLQDMKDKPHIYKNSIISPGLLESTMQKIQKGLTYDVEVPNNFKNPEFIPVKVSNIKVPEIA